MAREQDLNINSLKIDKAFVWKLRELAPEKVILGDIISMAHKMGHCVVAEGVEDELQLNYLIEHGCDQVQGFYFAKSLSEEDALKMLQDNKASYFWEAFPLYTEGNWSFKLKLTIFKQEVFYENETLY